METWRVIGLVVCAVLLTISIAYLVREFLRWRKKARQEKAAEDERAAKHYEYRREDRQLALALSTAMRMKDEQGYKETLANYLAFLRTYNPNANEALARSNAQTEEIARALGR